MLNSTESGTEVIAIIGTVIYAGGFLGNLLSLTIFIPLRIRRVSTGLLFLCLTISNNIHLITLFVEFLDTAFQSKLPTEQVSSKLITKQSLSAFQFVSSIRFLFVVE